MRKNECWEQLINKGHSIANTAVKSFKKCQSTIDADLLQRAVRDMSRDSEAFIELRKRFASTLAVYTICGYILGIGDRHLDVCVLFLFFFVFFCFWNMLGSIFFFFGKLKIKKWCVIRTFW